MSFWDKDFIIQAVQQSEVPPYAYTIGLTKSSGFELICAGALALNVQEVGEVLRVVARHNNLGTQGVSVASLIEVQGLGQFQVKPAERSWVDAMVPETVRASSVYFHVAPTGAIETIDVPDMSVPRVPSRDSAWRWLDTEWDLHVPRGSLLGTSLGVLTAAPPVSVFRWEDDYWELLDRPADQLPDSDRRVVPIGMLPCVLSDWRGALSLQVGQGLVKEGDSWQLTY